jgi:hypothetical protein
MVRSGSVACRCGVSLSPTSIQRWENFVDPILNPALTDVALSSQITYLFTPIFKVSLVQQSISSPQYKNNTVVA